VVKETAKDLEWQIPRKTSTVIVSKSGFSWRRWGELITIIREKTGFYSTVFTTQTTDLRWLFGE
jgi:hypothetical protein